MKIYGIQAGQIVQRGEQMTNKKAKQAQQQGGANKAALEPKQKQELNTVAKTNASKDATVVKKGGQPANQYADSYQPGRASTEVPVRSEKVEHARAMIKKHGYDNPQVLEAIIDRLVFALKE